MNRESVSTRVHPRRAYPWRVLPALLVLCVPWLTVSASEKPRFDSQLRDGAITVDGKFDDWYGTLTSFGNDPVSIQFLNDSDYLYMRMTASDSAARMEIVRQGLTVWFDPAGGTKKHLGIRFPIVEHGDGGGAGGPGGQGGRGGYGGYGGHGGGRSRPGGGDGDPSAPPSDEPIGSDRVDILGPGKDDARSLTREHLQGIDVAMRREQGSLQYELRVPIAKTADHPYAIEALAGKPIGVGLESGKTEQHAASGRGGGFGGGGGGGGMGGRGGGGMGGGGGRGGGMHGGGGGGAGRGGSEPPKPLKGWGLVTIASQPAR